MSVMLLRMNEVHHVSVFRVVSCMAANFLTVCHFIAIAMSTLHI